MARILVRQAPRDARRPLGPPSRNTPRFSLRQATQGSERVAGNIIAMKICDICGKTTDRLESGPEGVGSLDLCGDCRYDLIKRLSKLDQHLTEMRTQMRADTITEWRTARTPADGASTPLKS